MGGAGKPPPVLLGAARPKPPPARKYKRVKLEFGEEIRAVDLPLPAELHGLVELVREEFGTDNLDIRYSPSPVIRVEVLVHAARHLPKADRAGLCDALVRAEVTPRDVYRYTGFYAAAAARSRTRIVPKSLNPDFNETLVLLVDGRGDPGEHGRPRLLLTLSDSDEGEEEMIGQVDLDLADIIAVAARCHVWERQEQELRDKLSDMQNRSAGSDVSLQQVKEASLTTSIDYLARHRARTIAALESMWVDLTWVPGCIATTKVEAGPEEDSQHRVRGADFKLANLHVGVRVHMTEYQQNCWLNSYYSFLDNVLEEARGVLKQVVGARVTTS
jgi:hypothetical protein